MTPAEQVVKALRVLLMVEREGRVVGRTNGRKRIDPAVRFWRHVDKGANPSGCWLWTGARSALGYGRTHHYDGNDRRVSRNAHQVAWALSNGDTNGLCVLHRCDNRLCVNPEHLFLGTTQDNTADRHAKGRDATGPRNTKTKLMAADVYRVRALYAEGMSGPRIAAMFGVNNTTVYRLLSGKNHSRILASGGRK